MHAKRYPQKNFFQVSENFFPCELSEEGSSALTEAISACKQDASLFASSAEGDEGERSDKLSREDLETLVSAACEAGPVKGDGAEAVREAAIAVKKCFGDALKEEKEKV